MREAHNALERRRSTAPWHSRGLSEMHPAERVLYGVGYLGGAVVTYGLYVVTKELLFLWRLTHKAAQHHSNIKNRGSST